MIFQKEELERYSRQILLHGRGAQERLKAARVLVVGAGGIGSTLLPLLAASGVGRIELFDADRVERSNLGRQVMFRESDLEKNKAACAAAFLQVLNPFVEVIAHQRNFSDADAALFADCNLVCEGSDSLKTKFLANDLALGLGTPAFIAALGAAQGHAMLVADKGQACYRCVFDELTDAEVPNCATEGILSVFPAVVAATVAQAAVEFLLQPLRTSALWLFEKNHCRRVTVKKRQDCHHPT